MGKRPGRPGKAEILEELKQFWREHPKGREIITEHELGKYVNLLCPKDQRRYGDKCIEKLARELGNDSRAFQNRLYSARDLFSRYTKKELQKLIAAAKAAKKSNRFKLSAFHIYQFMTIDNKELRTTVERQCIEHNWTANRVQQQVIKLRGKKSGGGLPPAKPNSVEDGLLQLISETGEWLRRYRQAWFGGESPVFRKLTRQEIVSLDEEIREAADLLQELSRAARAGRAWLNDQTLSDEKTTRKASKSAKRPKRKKSPRK